ncbi:hypothetical protein BESB_023820 [Besnoitia besnoiti]|uniref:Uncharacterized protein n=1 Tax=Besnoitia besnoiti TaxID=94643 RepID=A0A2A9M926_BESBE|nr:hypothetical protein BESB_023820 [Besnoitia besnoiti]PFH31890.1 hypothetical protein BESB_023820 [Besnoitia besnoiti]
MKVEDGLLTPSSLLRLAVEATCMLLLFATAIGNLSGYSWFHNSLPHQELPTGQKPSAPPSGLSESSSAGVILDSAKLQEEMTKAGLLISACYEERRTSQREFVVCMGRMPCDGINHGAVALKGAKHVLATAQGQEKAISVARSVVVHLSRQLGTSDLPAIFAEAKGIGLACDSLQV